MEMIIRPLAPGMAGEFFRFFEESAFPWGDPRTNCYCLESCLADEQRYQETTERRWVAKHLIDAGELTGYLLYDGERPVGWCNAGDKAGYPPVCQNPELFTTQPRPGQIRIVYCIDIAEGWQGKGLASLMMRRFLADAQAQGYRFAEGYPFVNQAYAWQYPGPVRLYEKFGFSLFREGRVSRIYRKELLTERMDGL